MTRESLVWAVADVVALALCALSAPLALPLWLCSRVRGGRG